MKQMKRLMAAVLSLVIFAGSVSMSAQAAETVYPAVHHTYTTTGDFSEDAWEVIQRGAYLGTGTCSISRRDSTHIDISGITTATQTCDEVELWLFVERSTSYATGYSTYRSYSYASEDVYQLVKEISNIKVDRGYYYRVKAVHHVTHNGVLETTNSVTNPIDYR